MQSKISTLFLFLAILLPLKSHASPQAASDFILPQNMQDLDFSKVYSDAFSSCAHDCSLDSNYALIGWLYQNGLGVERNLAKARTWYEKARKVSPELAELPLALMDSPSQKLSKALDLYFLALIHVEGIGMKQAEPSKAIHALMSSAKLGYAFSYAELGNLYHYGRGVEKNYAQAVKFYIQSIAHGGQFAKYLMGHMYEMGLGVEQDNQQALEWYLEAVDNKVSYAKIELWEFERLAELGLFDWIGALKKAANSNNGFAQYQLAQYYYNSHERDLVKALYWTDRSAGNRFVDAESDKGIGYMLLKDYPKALEWFEKAGAKGYGLAQYWAGYLYEHLSFDAGAHLKAYDWYKKGALSGESKAEYALARYYYEGKAGVMDFDKALFWHKKAASSGVGLANLHLGEMYEKGDRVTQNYSKAHIHYTRAAESDIGLAAYRLGLLHEKGLGVEKNDEKAIFNYKYAIRLGYKEGEHGVRWLTLKKELGTQPKPQYSN